jgi:hypothetical protein
MPQRGLAEGKKPTYPEGSSQTKAPGIKVEKHAEI